MTSLNDYLMAVQRLSRDMRQELLNVGNLISYVNMARREIAERAQCIRVLTPISGSVLTGSVVDAGSGYTAATITVSDPDFPSGYGPFPGGDAATASVFVQGGAITGVDITYGGSGYFQPTASITGDGTGASVTLQTTSINILEANKEVYAFADVDLSPFPGVEQVFAVQGISVIYANYRYSLPVYSFSTYQAKIRQYPFQYTYVPAFASQYGQGANGSFYVYPLPSQTYQYELDCYCLPSDLTTNLSVEAIPAPWTDSVKFMTLYFAFLELQNYNIARFWEEEFEKWVQRHSNYARPGRAVNPYGRY